MPTIPFPISGVNRRQAYASQPAGTAIGARNMRAVGATTGRVRGGTRPGLTRAFSETLGSSPITGTVDHTTYNANPPPLPSFTQVFATAPVFAPWMMSKNITFVGNGGSTNAITTFVSPTQVIVAGAVTLGTGTGAGTFTVPYGVPVSTLVTVRPAEGLTSGVFLDDFESVAQDYAIGTNNSRWTTPWGLETAGPLTCTVVDGKHMVYPHATAYSSTSHRAEGQALLQKIVADYTQPYTVSMLLSPNGGHWPVASYILLLRMQDASPTLDNSVRLQVDVPGDDQSWTAQVNAVAGGGAATPVIAAKTITLSGVYPVWVKAVLTGNQVAVYVDDNLIGSATYSPGTPANFGSRVAVYLMCPYPPASGAFADAIPLLDDFKVEYTMPTVNLDTTRSFAFAAAGGVCYHEDNSGRLVAVGGAVNLSPTRSIDAVEQGGQLYFADNDAYRVQATGCSIAGAGGVGAGKIITSAATFTGMNIDTDNDLAVVTGAGVVPGAYKIVNGGVGTHTLTLVDCPDTNASNLTVRVERAPKVYNPLTNAMSIWTTVQTVGNPAGAMPLGCPLIASYRGRLVLGGASAAPHVWYMSRAGNPLDFNYGADPDDQGKAVAGSNASAGQIGKPLTAICGFCDDYLILACERELWAMRGDPAAGGMISNISYKVGIQSKRAWCHTPAGDLVFLSHNGLYVLTAGGMIPPECLSDEVLPGSFFGIDPARYTALLGWDPEKQGVHIYLTPNTADPTVQGQTEHWFYDWTRKAFWPVTLWTAHEPFTLCSHHLQGVQGQVLLLGGRDGGTRRYSESSATDEGGYLNAWVLIGPQSLPGDDIESLWNWLHCRLGNDSGSINWSIFSDCSAEQAFADFVDGTPNASGAVDTGIADIAYPRVRGVSHYLLLASPPGGVTSWEVEEILGKFETFGPYVSL